MDTAGIIATIIIVSFLGAMMSIGYFIADRRYKKRLSSLNDLKQQHSIWTEKLKNSQDELWAITQRIDKSSANANVKIAEINNQLSEKENITNTTLAQLEQVKNTADKKINELNQAIERKQQEFSALNSQTLDLQKMQNERKQIEMAYALLPEKQTEILNAQIQLDKLQSEISLYSDIESYIDYGIYPLPKYGEVTSGAYNEKLKVIRQNQKEMLKNNRAYTFPKDIEITGDETYDNLLAKNQGKLLITAFNSECDYLISKINSKNYEASLTKIEKLAEQLEKNLLSLEIGISLSYIELKMKECQTYYQYICQKEMEAEEQREIRNQIREEVVAQREMEKAIREAEKEEQLLEQAIETARRQLESATQEQKQKYEQKISELSQRLADAEAKQARALSMAQQTKHGHVYIISNIGSFGENVYKIGMTRRLEPLDRIYELSNASVPFGFDVHAMIASENAPALEKELHEYFADYAVNKVNSRKEFFEVDIEEIRNYLDNKGIQVHWTMVAEATQYRQSISLNEEVVH